MKLSSSLVFLVVATLLVYCTVTNGIRLKQPKDFNELKKLNFYTAKTERVVGGQTAEDGFAPYQISLQYSDVLDHRCGGSIIDKNWILTAGHCVASSIAEKLVVITGTNQWEKPGAKYFVDQIHIHCNHNNPSLHNDIALLHLNTSIEYNAKTQSIALPKKQMKPGEDLILTGWGQLEYDGETADDLQKITLKYVEHERCKKMFNYSKDLDIGHICAFTRHGEGACNGDSGGPLVNKKGEVVGVVNWGYPCAIGVPDVFASPYYYRDWIRKIRSGHSKC